MKLRWRFGILAGIVLLVCGMYPQMKMWYLRGTEWQGHYAYNDIDEVAYASYLKALIDGRPRRNDPYTGRDDTPEKPQEESLFSIQFAAPYSIAIPARLLGIDAPTAMWLSGAVAAFLTGLFLFWLIGRFTDDSLFAMTGAIVVVCGGTLAAGEGAALEIFAGGFSYPYFPGFRRYVPMMPFAVFFALCASVWLMVKSEETVKRIAYCVLASLCFAYCVFSYFYIWTTAAAWLACLVAVWLAVRPEGWRKDFKLFSALGIACLAALVPYAVLLSNRSHTMDDVQLLVFSRELDLWRVPELISFAVLAMLAVAVLLKVFGLRERATLFVVSLAFVPPAVFNQQVLTGRVLQPIHYQVFIGNYVAALALVLTFGLLWRKFGERKPFVARAALSGLAMLAAAWGIVECHYTVRVLDDANIARDEAMRVARRLNELSKTENPRGVVYAPDLVQGDDLPTIAPQTVLWARHQHVFAGVTWQENKERYYQHLHFMGIDEKQLAHSMKNGDFVSTIALFGWGRHTDRLNPEYKPLTYGEIDEEAARFAEYIKNFNPKDSPETIVSYIVAPADWELDFSNFDRWYERAEPEKHGRYLLYRVSLRDSEQQTE
jgi:hypothetical protein